MELGIEIGNWDWRLGIDLRLGLGIRDWDGGGIGICNWVGGLVLGLGIGIENWDWGLGMVLGIRIGN